jgi:Pyruvate/2-oxoacid:ferredoxin oxidoreductase delta subunit
MGHLVGKDIYRKLGKKIDSLSVRTPWNKQFEAILKELYTTDEANLVAGMPYGLCDIDQIKKATGYEMAKLQNLLDGLSAKGLVLDIHIGKRCRYIISPLIIGIFEFTMMRTRGELNTREWARLFYSYLEGDNSFYSANFGNGQRISLLRALPHEEAFDDAEVVEVLDYEKASAIIDNARKFAIGICSCRHEKLHAGMKKCETPLETCSTFDGGTDYMISHGFAKSVSKSEMLENLARCRELGLVVCADNVKKDVSFLCFCCGCCCNVLLGISKHGYPNSVTTSSFIARREASICTECGTCAEVCPINAISLLPDGAPEINESFCIGCGVCALKCATGAMRLAPRKQRVLHPETMFERIILQCLERGTLQNFLITDPRRLTHKFLRGFLGGFLNLPPVKKSLMSDTLRSSFLQFMQKRAG